VEMLVEEVEMVVVVATGAEATKDMNMMKVRVD
jgi:hypothetical protein